jgi:ribosomal protein S18 acetylase RimI-like enzyme
MEVPLDHAPYGPAELQIRPLDSPEDFDACAAIMASSDPWRRLGAGLDTCRRALSQPEREPWGACKDGRLVAFALLSFKGPFIGYVQLLGVAADQRGRGIGSALLTHAEQCIFARTPNVFICVSSFNENAQRFYDRQGYRTVGRLANYLVQGHDELLLRKTLGPLLGGSGSDRSRRP